MAEIDKELEQIQFSDDQIEAIKKGFEGMEERRGLTADQARDVARKRTEAWMSAASTKPISA